MNDSTAILSGACEIAPQISVVYVCYGIVWDGMALDDKYHTDGLALLAVVCAATGFTTGSG